MIELKELPNCRRVLTVVINAETMAAEFEKDLRKAAKRVKVDGFRPGRVPLDVARQRLGPAVRAELTQRLHRERLAECAAQNKLTLVGEPEFLAETWEEGQDYALRVEFEVLPNVQIGDLSELEPQLFECRVTDAEVDEVLADLVKMHVKYAPVDRGAQDGDLVTIEFGQAGQSKTHAEFILGRGQMLPQFESGVLGAEDGQILTLLVDFPPFYHKEELAGKSRMFEVVVLQVAEPVYPEIDLEFARRFGEFESVEAFQAAVKRQMEAEAAESLELKNKTAAFTALLEAYPVEAPPSLVARELASLAPIETPGPAYEAQARQRVAFGILVAALAEQRGIETDQENAVFELIVKEAKPVFTRVSFEVATGAV